MINVLYMLWAYVSTPVTLLVTALAAYPVVAAVGGVVVASYTTMAVLVTWPSSDTDDVPRE